MEYHKIISPPQSKALKSGKVILASGEEVGWHKTENKEEIIVCLSGSLTLMIGKETKTIQPGETAYVKEETEHNVINKTDKEAKYVYIVHLFDKSV